MYKLVIYLALTVVGMIGALFSPVVGAIAAFEAYLFNPTIFGYPEIRYQLMTTVAFALGVLIHSMKRPLRPVGGEIWVIVCLWMFLLIASLTSLMAQVSTVIAFTWLFEVVKTVIITTLLVRALRTERDVRWVMLAFIIGIAHGAAVHVLGPKLGYVSFSRGREYGVLPDEQTPVTLCFIPLLLVCAVTGKTKWEKLMAFLALPLAVDSIVNTYQRTGFVAMGVEFVLIMLFGGGKVFKRLAPLALVGGILFVTRMTPDNYWQWVATISAPTKEGSANSRFVLAQTSIKMLKDHPLGVGYRNYTFVSGRYLGRSFLTAGGRSAHNTFFAVACETGILGFLVWISAFGGSIILLRRVRKPVNGAITQLGYYALALEVGLYGWLAAGLFGSHHEVDPAYWFVGIAVVMTRLHKQAEVDAASPIAAPVVYQPVAGGLLRQPTAVAAAAWEPAAPQLVSGGDPQDPTRG